MRFFHLSDLHIGKQLHGYSLAEEQRDVLHQVVAYAQKERPDAILIAGDIYDKSVPSGEAQEIFDEFLQELSRLSPEIPTCIIAGNHDSAQRLKFASSFLQKHQIYVSVLPPAEEEEYLSKITLRDEYGEVAVYLLPFTKPAFVRGIFSQEEAGSYQEAVEKVLAREEIDYSKRNVLVAHQFFVAGEEKPWGCDSELSYLSVGGIDQVHIDCVRNFDYVALGHIHGEQSIGEKWIRYSGTPLKYSVSEEYHEKGITVVTLGRKGDDVEVERLPLHPVRDVITVRGMLREVVAQANEKNRQDYVSITLLDEESLYRPKDELEKYYDHILEVRVENQRMKAQLQKDTWEEGVISPLEAFREFYQMMNGQPLSQREEEEMSKVIQEVMG